MLRRVKASVRDRILTTILRVNPRTYWAIKWRRFGTRAVINLGYRDEQVQAVSQQQLDLVLGVLREELSGGEHLLLDFGCGPGRLTAQLREVTTARIVGTDIIPEFLDAAPRAEGVEYLLMKNGIVPLPDTSVDAMLVFTVLGGLTTARRLEVALSEMKRLVRPGGLLVLVENTSRQSNAGHWHFRSISEYRQLLPDFCLEHRGDTDDLGEQLSLLCGRRHR